MELFVIGLVSAINLIIIKMKFERKRYEDGFFDLSLMAILVVLFSGSYAGMVVAMVASMFISLYLLASPPKFTKGWFEGANKVKQEIKDFAEFDLTKKPKGK